ARFMARKSFNTLADNLHDVMVETLPIMVDKHIKEQVMKQVPEQVRNQVPMYVAEGLILERQKAKEETERLISKAILQELDASVRSYMSGHILHVHPDQSRTSSVPEQQYQLYLAMKADPQLQQLHVELLPFAQEIRTILMMMLILRGRIVQNGRRHRSMKLMYMESHHLDKFFKRNKLHQL
ncbi:hypothetical protein Tco_0225282, partial [Tanacetum coccineum]